MISSSCWVPRGFASEFPEKYELNDEEMERIQQLASLELNDAKENIAQFKDQIDQDDDLKEYDLEHYDDEEDADGTPLEMFPGLSNATLHQGEDEQYISLPNEIETQQEKADLQVYPTDNMVLATRTEDDISYLDVYVYDDGAGAPVGANEEEEDKIDADVAKGLIRESNLYVHHDLMLPAFPLCVEWVNYKEDGGNFAAVGTFDPQIEIWNLDCIDKAFPDMILGEQTNKKKKKKSHTHTDAILSLSHNKIHRSVLASTSADGTIKLWDLTTEKVARSLDNVHQRRQVSSSQWFSDGFVLLTGGYDGSVAITDVRISDEKEMTKRWRVAQGEEVENVKWSFGTQFLAGTDKGNIYCFDASVPDKPLWTLHAHDAGISCLEVNAFLPGLIVTGAMGEKQTKLWKVPISQGEGHGPSMILSRDFGVGNVLSASFAPDIEVAGHLTVGGVTGDLNLWDCFSNRAVRSSLGQSLRELQKRAREQAKSAGRASRIARKYLQDQSEVLIQAENGGSDESEDEEAE